MDKIGRIVNTLIEGASIPIKVRLADGSEIEAEFNGYYDLSFAGKGKRASVGKKLPGGGFTHGIHDPSKETIIGDIPSPEEWEQNAGVAQR